MSVDRRQGGRARQRRRTRDLLLAAAGALTRSGAVPTVEQAAAAAEVSPATGYRYFPSQGALVQALVEDSMPAWDERPLSGDDVLERMDAAITAGVPLLLEHEAVHRAALRLSLDPAQPALARGGRRRAIAEVLAPVRARLDATALRRVEGALTLVLGIESIVALRDVLELDDTEIEGVVRFTCRAILRTALDEAEDADGMGQ